MCILWISLLKRRNKSLVLPFDKWIRGAWFDSCQIFSFFNQQLYHASFWQSDTLFPFKKTPFHWIRDKGLIRLIYYGVKVQTTAKCHHTGKQNKMHEQKIHDVTLSWNTLGKCVLISKKYLIAFILPCIWSSGSERFLSAGMYFSTTVSSPLYCIRDSVEHSICKKPTNRNHYKALQLCTTVRFTFL